MKAISPFVLVAIFFGISFGNANVLAANPQVDTFLKSIKRKSIDFKFLRDGLNSTSTIRFTNQQDQYEYFFNRISVAKDLEDKSKPKNLKTFDQISSTNFAALAHEAFHAYFANLATDSRDPLRLRINSRADELFSDLGAENAREVLEESYAAFIQIIISSYLGIDHQLTTAPFESCEKTKKMLTSMWSGTWKTQIFGYYHPGSFKHIKAELTQEGQEIVKQNLPEQDREWIATHLFEGAYSSDIETTFKTALAPCKVDSLDVAVK